MKVLSRFITVLMLVFTFALPAHAQLFADVSGNYPYQTAIEKAARKGLVSGHSDNTFRPNDPINRAEVAKILVSATHSDSEISSVMEPYYRNNWRLAEFDDVYSGDWFAPYVVLAKKSGMVKGYPNGVFRPSGNINYAEGLKMAIEAFEGDVSRIRPKSTPYILMNGADWYSRYFSYALSKNLIREGRFYHPGQTMTRGEFVEVLTRMMYVADANYATHPFEVPADTSEYRITIPKLGIVDMDVRFANPYDAEGALEILRHSPFGHYLAEPGTGDKFVLYGHSSAYAWDTTPFRVVLRKLNRLAVGDRIYINYKGQGHIYEMTRHDIVPAEQDYRILDNPSKNEMAIYTCWPPDNISHRYVIYAKPVY